MTQPNILELAKQGNPQAIAALINRQLQPKGITAKATLKDRCLQIMLEASQVPNQQALVEFVRKGITGLGVASIERVKIYGRQAGEDIPAWSQEIELSGQILSSPNAKINESIATPPPPQSSSLKERASNGDLDAIIQILNFAFKHKNITVTATRKDTCLQIFLESDHPPDAETSMRVIRREWSNFKSKPFKIVQIRGKQLNKNIPEWEQEIKEDTIQVSNQAHKQDQSRLSYYVSAIKGRKIPDAVIKLYKQVLQLPKYIKIGVIGFIILVLGVFISNKIYESQPISGKMYLVLGRGATPVPDATVEIIKCKWHSELCGIAEDWLQQFNEGEYLSSSATEQLKFLIIWSQLRNKLAKFDITAIDNGDNLAKYYNLARTDFNGDFKGACDAPSCFLIAQGEAGLASSFWVIKIKPGEQVNLSNRTAIYTYNKSD